MLCVKCGHTGDRVIDSRETRDGLSIRRRRQCLECGERFTTYEMLERRHLFVVKRDGIREPFARDKLAGSMDKACEKRPVSRETVDAAVDSIVTQLESGAATEIPSTEIGLLVMKELQRIDPVAYVRFASVYRQFQDVGEFIDEIRALERDPLKNVNHPELFPSL